MSSYSAIGLGVSLLLHAGMLAGGTMLVVSPSGGAVESPSLVLPAVVSIESVSVEPSLELNAGSVSEVPAAPESSAPEPLPVEQPLQEILPILHEQPAPLPTPVSPPPTRKKARVVNKAVQVREVSVEGDGPPSAPQVMTGASMVGGGGGSTVTEMEAKPDAPRNAPPEYPYAARRARQQGTVLLLVEVDCDGSATNVQLHRSCGHSLLDEAAKVAVEKWRFRPASAGGIVKASRVVVPVRFVLNR